MNKTVLTITVTILVMLVAMGCSNSAGNPVLPDENVNLTQGNSASGMQTHLWGYYTVYVDVETETVEAVIDRSGMFTANVTNFLNGSPFAMSFLINEIVTGTDYIDIDIDVGLTHPFPGMPQYNGYDVRGAFMGDGSASLASVDVDYPVPGTDQFMLADPNGGNGAPDGYTRWFNRTEFNGGVPLLSYTQGNLATAGFAGSATISPYKYFADSLGTNEDLFAWLNANGDQKGVFSSGATNRRNYYLRFPNSTDVVYGYAVTANWEGTDSEFHPSNAIEAVACNVADNSNVFYVDPGSNGGMISLDLSIFDWNEHQLSGGVMTDYEITLESTVLSGPHGFDESEMTPIDGSEHYSTFHVELAADNVTGTEGNEYWILVEYTGYDYSNDLGVPNQAENDTLTAFFRYDLDVSDLPTNQPPVCDLQVVSTMPAEYWDDGTPVDFNASGSYDPDGDDLTFEWDFNDDSVYGDDYEGDPDTPTHYYTADHNGDVWVRVSDGIGGVTECSVVVEVITHQSKNIPLHPSFTPTDLAIDHVNGDIEVLYTDGAVEQVWKISRSSWYQSSSHFFNSWFATVSNWAIDVSPNQHTITTGNYASGQPLTEILDPNGLMLYPLSQGGTGTPSIEVFTMTAGDYEDDLGNILGWPVSGNNGLFAIRYPDGDWFYGHTWHYYWPTVTNGINQLYWDWVVAVESDATGNFLWYLENEPGENYAARWELSNSGFPYDQSYSNAYFGVGTQTDNDDGWNNGLDITRDDSNNYFVLDELSTGAPRIKMWSVDGDDTTSEGGFGDSTSISGTPLRIEGSDWSGEIVVLHGNSAPYMISVFTPHSMPN